MTEKQYTSLQRLVQAALATAVASVIVVILVSTYAFSSWLLS